MFILGCVLGLAIGFLIGHLLPPISSLLSNPTSIVEMTLWESATIEKADKSSYSDWIITVPTNRGNTLRYRGDIYFCDMDTGHRVDDRELDDKLNALVRKHKWDQEVMEKLARES